MNTTNTNFKYILTLNTQLSNLSSFPIKFVIYRKCINHIWYHNCSATYDNLNLTVTDIRSDTIYVETYCKLLYTIAEVPVKLGWTLKTSKVTKTSVKTHPFLGNYTYFGFCNYVRGKLNNSKVAFANRSFHFIISNPHNSRTTWRFLFSFTHCRHFLYSLTHAQSVLRWPFHEDRSGSDGEVI